MPTVPLRVIDHAPRKAAVNGETVAWRCVCVDATELSGRSGRVAGPSKDDVVLCPGCGRAYFVIPATVSNGAPVEVVELLAVPAE